MAVSRVRRNGSKKLKMSEGVMQHDEAIKGIALDYFEELFTRYTIYLILLKTIRVL